MTNSPDGGYELGTAARIHAYIVESFLFGDDDGFGDADSLIESGVIDSTGVMEIVAFLEETFALEIDEEDLIADNLDSVERLATFVDRQLVHGAGHRADVEGTAS
ncbi:MAG: acyl carrier protein [Acidimicrobiia bacterium]